MLICVEFEAPEFTNPKIFSEQVIALLESIAPVAQRIVATLPPLYRSGVRFREEPRGYESLVTPNIVFRRGHGDCAHLCLWRVAELRNQGNPAGFRIAWAVPLEKSDLSHRLFHVQVRHGLPKNTPLEKRPYEDPSVLLGMPPGGYI